MVSDQSKIQNPKFSNNFPSMNKLPFYLLLLGLLSGFTVVAKNKQSQSAVLKDTLLLENIFPLQQQHCHGSTIVELPNHDLLCAWFQGSGERTADDVAIKGARYNHKTRQWGKPFEMADTKGFPDINPVLFIDAGSKLWLTWYTVMAYQWSSSLLKYRYSDNYMQKEGAPEWKWQDVLHVKADGTPTNGIGSDDQFVKILLRKFNDYQQYLVQKGDIRDTGKANISTKDWEKARKFYLDLAKGSNFTSDGTDVNENGERVKKQLGYPLMRRIGWQTRNKPLQFGNRILLPLYSDGLNLSLIAITSDFGETWNFSEPILGGGAIQPTLALNKDGSITAYMRDNGPAPKRLMKSISRDGGLTWSSVVDTDIPNPGTAADIVVLKSGNRALVMNDVEEGRHKLSVWLSTDEGQSWPYRKILVNGKPNSAVRGHYPAIIQGKDGMIHVCFTNQVAGPDGKSEIKNIVHAMFSENWLMQ
jgi:predicted neuraminidase